MVDSGRTLPNSEGVVEWGPCRRRGRPGGRPRAGHGRRGRLPFPTPPPWTGWDWHTVTATSAAGTVRAWCRRRLGCRRSFPSRRRRRGEGVEWPGRCRRHARHLPPPRTAQPSRPSPPPIIFLLRQRAGGGASQRSARRRRHRRRCAQLSHVARQGQRAVGGGGRRGGAQNGSMGGRPDSRRVRVTVIACENRFYTCFDLQGGQIDSILFTNMS